MTLYRLRKNNQPTAIEYTVEAVAMLAASNLNNFERSQNYTVDTVPCTPTAQADEAVKAVLH